MKKWLTWGLVIFLVIELIFMSHLLGAAWPGNIYHLIVKNNHLGLMIEILGATATIISIALPITIDIISRVTEKYNIPDIAQHFVNKREYKMQKFSIFILFVYVVILLCIPEKPSYSYLQQFLILFSLICFFGITVSFFNYITMVTNFISTNEIENTILENAKRQAEEAV